ncbi:MAG: glycosyltransferase family 39 protein [Vicinamibacteria bacterium]
MPGPTEPIPSSEGPRPGTDGGTQRRRRTAWLILAAAIAIYTSTGPAFLNGDAIPARYLPFSLLREGDYDLDEFTFLYDEAAVRSYPSPEGWPYFLTRQGGHFMSRYSPASGTLAVPFYALPVLAGISPTSHRVWRLERFAAGSLIALSAVFVFLALCERTSRRHATILAVLYAFGTGSFSLTSQILWEQTSTQFLLAAGLLCVLRAERDRRYLWWAGVALAGATVTRMPDFLLTAPLCLYLLVRHRTGALRVVAGGLVPIAAMAAYNLAAMGSLAGSDRAASHFAAYVWAVPLLDGLYGLLFSPSRGLFFFCPFLLFALPGVVAAWRRGPTMLRYASLGMVAFVCLYAKYIYWDGGWGYGPRFLVDITALLCLFLAEPLEWIWARTRWRRVFLAAGGLSVGIHALGAYTYDPAWEGRAQPFASTYRRVGRWRDNQVFHHWRRLYDKSPLPTSANAPLELAARYEVDARPRVVRAGAAFEVPIEVTNTGRALWLNRTEGYFGTVRLAWLWYQNGKPLEATKGREDMPLTVDTEESVRFAGRMAAPEAPGDYVLKMGMVSELFAFFHDQAVPDVEIPVHVTPATEP